MRILVIGGTGNVGRRLVRELGDMGIEVGVPYESWTAHLAFQWGEI